jgi:chromosome segregation ATPase
MRNSNGVEKYAEDFGSSVMLNELIGLVNGRYKILEDKLAAAEARAEKAELEKQKLEVEVYILRDRVHALEEKISGNGSTGLEDVKKNILQLLAKRSDLETEAVAAVLKISPEVAASHLKELENRKLAYGSYDYAMSEPTTWFLLQDGRNYLIANGLI